MTTVFFVFFISNFLTCICHVWFTVYRHKNLKYALNSIFTLYVLLDFKAYMACNESIFIDSLQRNADSCKFLNKLKQQQNRVRGLLKQARLLFVSKAYIIYTFSHMYNNNNNKKHTQKQRDTNSTQIDKRLILLFAFLEMC